LGARGPIAAGSQELDIKPAMDTDRYDPLWETMFIVMTYSLGEQC